LANRFIAFEPEVIPYLLSDNNTEIRYKKDLEQNVS